MGAGPFPTKTGNPPFGTRPEVPSGPISAIPGSVPSAAKGGVIPALDDGGDVPTDAFGSQEPTPQSGGQLPSIPYTMADTAPNEGGDMGNPQPQQAPTTYAPYLLGQDAVPQQALEQAKTQVDPQGQMDPTQRTMEAIAAQESPEDAFGYLQAARKQSDAYKHWGAAALNGTDGKPPNLPEAINAANKANENVPDGVSVRFSPQMNNRAPIFDKVGITPPTKGQDTTTGMPPTGNGGVTAAVKDLTTGQAQKVDLTVPQFHEFLRGQSGQFDNLMDNHAGNVIQKVAQGQGRPLQQRQQQRQPNNVQPADTGGGQVVIHAVGPGPDGTSGVRIGKDLAHMKPLNYEPITDPNNRTPPTANSVGGAGFGKPGKYTYDDEGHWYPSAENHPGTYPAGSKAIPYTNSNDVDVGVPRSMRPERVVPDGKGGQMVQMPDGSTKPYQPGNQEGGSGIPASNAPVDARYRIVRGGFSTTDYDANGQPIPQYNAQQRSDQLIQDKKNEGQIATWGVRSQSTADIARQKIAQSNLNNWRTNATRIQQGQLSDFTHFVNGQTAANPNWIHSDEGLAAIQQMGRRLGMDPNTLLEHLQPTGGAPMGGVQGGGVNSGSGQQAQPLPSKGTPLQQGQAYRDQGGNVKVWNGQGWN
jgi:hypothetical protein